MLQPTEGRAGEIAAQVAPMQLTPQAIEVIKANIILCEELVFNVLEPGIDYGKVEDVPRPFLFDPGAGKITAAFNTYATHTVLKEQVEADFICYVIEVHLVNRVNGVVVASGIGAASTWETKHKYRWVKQPEDYGYNKEGLKYNPERKKYRVPNPEHGELLNTVLKMAAKRGEVDAVQNLPGVGSALRKLFGVDETTETDWTWFWGRVRAMGLNSDQVHIMLGVKSLKDYLATGKTLRDAAEFLAREQPSYHAPTEAPAADFETVRRDLSKITSKTDFFKACFDDFKLQPDEAIELSGSSEKEITSWSALYVEVAALKGKTVIDLSTGSF